MCCLGGEARNKMHMPVVTARLQYPLVVACAHTSFGVLANLCTCTTLASLTHKHVCHPPLPLFVHSAAAPACPTLRPSRLMLLRRGTWCHHRMRLRGKVWPFWGVWGSLERSMMARLVSVLTLTPPLLCALPCPCSVRVSHTTQLTDTNNCRWWH